jgi:hypothetical protein
MHEWIPMACGLMLGIVTRTVRGHIVVAVAPILAVSVAMALGERSAFEFTCDTAVVVLGAVVGRRGALRLLRHPRHLLLALRHR